MLGFTALGFFMLLKHLDPEPKISLDTDWFYRRASAPFMRFMRGPLTRFEYGFVGEVYESVIRQPILGVAKALRGIDSDMVNAAAEGLGRSTRNLSSHLKTRVSGHAQHYGLLMALGIFLFFLWAVTLR